MNVAIPKCTRGGQILQRRAQRRKKEGNLDAICHGTKEECEEGSK